MSAATELGLRTVGDAKIVPDDEFLRLYNFGTLRLRQLRAACNGGEIPRADPKTRPVSFSVSEPDFYRLQAMASERGLTVYNMLRLKVRDWLRDGGEG